MRLLKCRLALAPGRAGGVGHPEPCGEGVSGAGLPSRRCGRSQVFALSAQVTGLRWWKSESWVVEALRRAAAPVSVLAAPASQKRDLLVQKEMAGL